MSVDIPKPRDFRLEESKEALPSYKLAIPDASYSWMYRTVYGYSVDDLRQTTELFPNSSTKKMGWYSLTVMNPTELYNTLLASNLEKGLDVSLITDAIESALPDSSGRHAFASVEGLAQFAGWIGVKVDYKGFDEEREIVSSVMKDVFGVEYDWGQVPHVSLARGQLTNLRNREIIEASLPGIIEFDKVQILKKN